MTRADPMQKIMHDLVLEPITDGTTDPGAGDPALLAQHPKCLGRRVFRPADCSGEIAYADSRLAVQAQQDLEPVGIGEQVEALRPTRGVDVGQRRRRTFDLCRRGAMRRGLVTGLHTCNLVQKAG
jgi:hypothetical protein